MIDQHLHDALMNWGRWMRDGKAGNAGGLVAGIYNTVSRGAAYRSLGAFSTWVPISDLDASLMNEFVKQLPEHLRRTSEVLFVSHPDHTRERQAQQLIVSTPAITKRLSAIQSEHSKWKESRAEKQL